MRATPAAALALLLLVGCAAAPDPLGGIEASQPAFRASDRVRSEAERPAPGARGTFDLRDRRVLIR